MDKEQLRDLHKLVWDFRTLAAEHWPTPPPSDSLRYAFTEAGEAMDALLREKRLGDKRNHDKDADRLDEWADCAIMLLTAEPNLIPIGSADAASDFAHRLCDEELCLRVAEHMNRINLVGLCFTLAQIAALPGMNLYELMRVRLARIMYKHVPAWKWGQFTAVLGELTMAPWKRLNAVPSEGLLTSKTPSEWGEL